MKTIYWGISALLHAAVIFSGHMGFSDPQYGMDAGQQGMEVNLVAAIPQETASESTAHQTEASPEMETPTIPETNLEPPAPKTELAVANIPAKNLPAIDKPFSPKSLRSHQPPTKERGDGSSPTPGKDATTAQSKSGAIVDSTPNYLRNPAPAYPEEWRMKKQQGLVILIVIIDPDGKPENIDIHSSSGCPRLDSAALQAVRHWRFRPATSLGINTRSRVKIPIRFKLEG